MRRHGLLTLEHREPEPTYSVDAMAWIALGEARWRRFVYELNLGTAPSVVVVRWPATTRVAAFRVFREGALG